MYIQCVKLKSEELQEVGDELTTSATQLVRGYGAKRAGVALRAISLKRQAPQ